MRYQYYHTCRQRDSNSLHCPQLREKSLSYMWKL
nr:MAG TPA: hypothetical protein [Caudoviricetes sp.]